MQSKIFFLLLSSSLVFFSHYLAGCAASSQTKGTVGGATAGAVLGAILGDKSGHEKEGAIAGAVVGGVIGNIIGRRLDEQAKALEEVPGVQDVEYNEEKQNIEAKVEVLFDTDKTDIKSSEVGKLDGLANVFAQYPENIIVIEGHTDSDGTEAYNQQLSERRAAAIESYLSGKNLDIASLSSVGYGETRPIASNASPTGKASNRRVEIKITVDPDRVPVPQDQSTSQGQQ